MTLTKQSTWKSYSLHLFTVVFILFANEALTEISSPTELIAKVGQNITFMFNASHEILGAKFGLHGNESYPIPKFITVINIRGQVTVTFAEDLDGPARSYKRRVSYTGDLEKGRAWFQISNLSASDTNIYSSSIRESIDDDYKQYLVVKLTVRGSEKISPPLASESRFTEFVGTAEKKCRSYAIVGKESSSMISGVIRKAYWHISINHEIKINKIRKTNKTVTAGFHITFSKPINKTYAHSFLQRAQQKKQLRGYQITCFDNVDPKPPKTEKPSIWSPPIIVVIALFGLLIVFLTIVGMRICYRYWPHLFEPFSKLFRDWARRLREAAAVIVNPARND